jgi:soluble methane monooxygenase-binding protein MmoD
MFHMAFEDPAAGAPVPGALDCTAAVIKEAEAIRQGRYRAIIQDLDFMWRWRIYRDGEMCQEGCSLSESSSREAIRHVLAFYEGRDRDEGE